jgi:hypothetical protein
MIPHIRDRLTKLDDRCAGTAQGAIDQRWLPHHMQILQGSPLTFQQQPWRAINHRRPLLGSLVTD